MKQYGKELSNPVLLRLPNGVKWKVDWTKRDGDIWFQKLWKAFAQYYPLSFGHFLVFRYEGRSNFQVLIFDTSALEIDYSSIRCTNEGEGTNKHHEDVEILDDNGRHKSPLLQPEKKMKTAERRCYINSLSENNEVAPSQRKKHDNTKIDFEGRRGSSSRSRRELENKCSKAYERAKNLKTEKYLNGIEGTATIWVKEDDKTWHIAFKFNTTNNKTILGTGWMTFVQDNNLKENDVCVFELIDRRNFSFKVTIFTFKEEEPSSEQIQGYS
ncbi:hypothetical protein RIF29_14732 [Crotalaria pallida]|uniref:TF-B3 domain-containing protein n=1 Tax=Crotalaria pallida TaxID=3830 RepID=A0AAN9FIL8_CROPI